MSDPRDSAARSVQARLAQHARALGVDPNLVLTRYAVERFLFRLSRSPHSEQFVLKGALLMMVWLGETLRPTSDADLLGFGELSDDALATLVMSVCTVPVEPDSVQLDVGFGDAVTPAAEWLEYPALLDLPRPRLRAYPRETVIAEKLHAMVMLGTRNSRMKDYFDLHALAREGAVDAVGLGEAIAATFARRSTVVPEGVPAGLGEDFTHDSVALRQWSAFVTRNRLVAPPFGEVVAVVREFIREPLRLARKRG